MTDFKNFIIGIVLLTCFLRNSFSQENSVFNSAYLNAFVINPACSGAEYYPAAHLSVKKQWLGFSDSPRTFLLSGNFRIGNYDFYDPKGFINKGPLKFKDNVGLGAAVFQDSNGPLLNTGGLASYAYHVPINSESRLSLGISAILIHYSINSSILKPGQSNDPYLLTGNNSLFKANVGMGIYYYNTRYFAGASVIKVLPGIASINSEVKPIPGYFFMAGYKFNRNSNSFNFEPSVCINKLFEDGLAADMHAKLYIKRLNWIAMSYSTSRRLNFQFGIRLYRMVYAGYNYEYSLSKISSYNMGTHEISLGINLGLIGIEGIREKIKKTDS